MDASTIAWLAGPGLATALGAPALLVVRRPDPRLLDAVLGFTAGVMLAATVFSLLVPALDRGSLTDVVAGLTAGFVLMGVLDAVLPHVHFLTHAEEVDASGRRVERQSLLMLAAMTIHNVPEGLAVGVAFGAGGAELGVPVALAIGLQNVPEGFAAGAPLAAIARRRWVPIAVAAATGLAEVPAAFAGYLATDTLGAGLAPSLAFAAGAMLYVIVDELVPESHAHGNERIASSGLFAGFVVMLVLDVSLG